VWRDKGPIGLNWEWEKEEGIVAKGEMQQGRLHGKHGFPTYLLSQGLSQRTQRLGQSVKQRRTQRELTEEDCGKVLTYQWFGVTQGNGHREEAPKN